MQPSPPGPPGGASEARCAKCGAPVTWDPATGTLTCEYCGGHTTVPAPAHEVPEHSLAEAKARYMRAGPDREVRHVECGECGAVIDLPPNAAAGRCPFCGAEAVAVKAEAGERIAPEGVLPFTVSKEAAQEAYQKWLAKLHLRPSNLKSQAHLEQLVGAYLPYWAFDADAKTWWRAHWGKTVRSASGDVHLQWHNSSDVHTEEYRRLLVHASRGLPKALASAIEPFPLDEIVHYEPSYLAGFAAELPATQPLDGWHTAREIMEADEKEAVLEHLEAKTITSLKMKTAYSKVGFRGLLLPVWIAAYRYGDTTYRFLVNGRTGKVEGKAPWSPVKVGLVGLAVAALVAIIAIPIVGTVRTTKVVVTHKGNTTYVNFVRKQTVPHVVVKGPGGLAGPMRPIKLKHVNPQSFRYGLRPVQPQAHPRHRASSGASGARGPPPG